MPRRYSVDGTQAVASPTDTVLGITSTTAIRPEIYDVIFGSSASPADNAIQWLMRRNTAAGSGGSAVTPNALDPDDPSSLTTAHENHGTEPTYTSNSELMNLVANQRSTQRWVAAPGGEMKIPATTAAGIGIEPTHSSFTGSVEATIHFLE